MTSVLSKVCERVFAKQLSNHLENTNAHGDTQWAFRRKRSRQDMIAVLMSKRLLALNSGKKVGVYLSDISSVFDRVRKSLMMMKAARMGLSAMWLKFIDSYLAGRQAFVADEGVHSEAFTIKDMLFQGIVIGPISWNVFFADINDFVTSIDVEEQRFADNL